MREIEDALKNTPTQSLGVTDIVRPVPTNPSPFDHARVQREVALDLARAKTEGFPVIPNRNRLGHPENKIDHPITAVARANEILELIDHRHSLDSDGKARYLRELIIAAGVLGKLGALMGLEITVSQAISPSENGHSQNGTARNVDPNYLKLY